MPFTLAHPAAVLPFARTKLVFSALIAGALAPDVGYFLTLYRPDAPRVIRSPGSSGFDLPAVRTSSYSSYSRSC